MRMFSVLIDLLRTVLALALMIPTWIFFGLGILFTCLVAKVSPGDAPSSPEGVEEDSRWTIPARVASFHLVSPRKARVSGRGRTRAGG
jgi:hypothetical protein